MTNLKIIVVLAALFTAAGPLAAHAQATVIVNCDGCDEFPLWLQVLLPLIGIGLAMAILYLPRRLARRARTQGQATAIWLGGVTILTVGLVVLFRAIVVVLGGT
ncbi:MAG: hypothetical protein ACRDGI_08450 [Candidatus Limnocylindrales bacterium]